MRIFSDFSIRLKLALTMIAIVCVALGLTMYVASSHAREALSIAADARLKTLIEGRQDNITTWFLDIEGEVIAQGKNPFVVTAYRAFRRGWMRQLDASGAETARTVLQSSFGQAATPSESLDRGYSSAHRRYHQYFKTVLETTNFADAFLIDLDGNVVYSTRKDKEFTTNLVDGPLSQTGLGDVFRLALASENRNPVHATFAPYPDASGIVTSFTARPLLNAQSAIIGVVAFKERLAPLERILRDQTDFGETGHALLLGPDRRVLLGADDHVQTSLDIAPVRRALAGHSGAEVISLDGVETVVRFAPISFFNRTWALVVMQSTEEIAAPAMAMVNAMLRDGMIIVLCSIFLALAMARSITSPLKRLQRAMGRIQNGHTSERVPETKRLDEVGQMARSLSEFRDAMALNEALGRENAFKGASFEAASSAQTLIDLDMRIAYANAAFSRLLAVHLTAFQERVSDIDPDFVVGRSIDVFQDDPERIRSILSAKENLPYQVDTAIGAADFVLIFSLVRDKADAPIGYVVEWEDVTEARMREAMLEAINTRQVMAEFDMDGRLVTANPAFCSLLDQKFSDLRGGSLDEYLEPADFEAGAEDIDIDNGLPGQSRFVTAGTARILEGGMTTVLDRTGVPIRLLLIGQDITRDHKRLMAAEAEKHALVDEQSGVVRSITNALSALAEGDLTHRITSAFPASYERLRLDFNDALQTLEKALQTVSQNAASIRGEAKEITSAADDLSKRTEHQAATLEETAAAVDLLTTNLRIAAGEADQADTVVRKARDHADTSGQVVSKAVQAMGQIEVSSNQISRIIGVIDDIAFQTNLLALNAGVEAARAGDAGRGFAVVASEVRALAQRSADAAREITALISKSSGHVQHGVELVGEAGRALALIVDTIGDVSQHVSQIAQSAGEQSHSIAEINVAVTNLDRVTQQNAAMFEETTAASYALTREAEQMTDVMGQFSLSNRQGPAIAPSDAALDDIEVSEPTGECDEEEDALPMAVGSDVVALGPPQSDVKPQSSTVWEEF